MGFGGRILWSIHCALPGRESLHRCLFTSPQSKFTNNSSLWYTQLLQLSHKSQHYHAESLNRGHSPTGWGLSVPLATNILQWGQDSCYCSIMMSFRLHLHCILSSWSPQTYPLVCFSFSFGPLFSPDFPNLPQIFPYLLSAHFPELLWFTEHSSFK